MFKHKLLYLIIIVLIIVFYSNTRANDMSEIFKSASIDAGAMFSQIDTVYADQVRSQNSYQPTEQEKGFLSADQQLTIKRAAIVLAVLLLLWFACILTAAKNGIFFRKNHEDYKKAYPDKE